MAPNRSHSKTLALTAPTRNGLHALTQPVKVTYPEMVRCKTSFACCERRLGQGLSTESNRNVGAFMTTMQAILFGMMLSWTPSVVLLAWLLWREDAGLDRNETLAPRDPNSQQLTEKPT